MDENNCKRLLVLFGFLSFMGFVKIVTGEYNNNNTEFRSCEYHSDCSEYQKCNRNVCNCLTAYQYSSDTESCEPCAVLGKACKVSKCCIDDNNQCIDGYCVKCQVNNNQTYCSTSNLVFITASEVALSTALIVGIAALVTLLYRMCSKRSVDRRNRSLIHTENENRNNSERASLSSLQIRILSRLRDRPPRYETRHNYEYGRSQSQTALEETISTPTRSDSNVPALRNEAPPFYDGNLNSSAPIDEQPPPYSIAITTPNICHPFVYQENGIINPGYEGVTTEAVPQTFCSVAREKAEDKRRQSNNDDKTIHM